MADINLNIIENLNNLNERKNFTCGVVEGFYGRPWTPEQRKDLFSKLQKWGMNCYLYAPKDDYKHRAYWRELYTVEEAEHLTALITEARNHNVTFYYAISPGLDITYSGQKEVSALKRKLEQVQQLGCNAFAILFDDIDPEMSGADKEVFQSFAHAQVSVTNDIFTHLNQPKFMFCPTQYCSTRAVPSIQTSEYLNTLGAKLAPEIDIMWTGPKVISKILTVEHIREVTEVLKRPPIIWDNLHANDYDQARLFLGPYCGRSPDLIHLLRGVVTNPNCEYGPNFIAINTLGQWSRSSVETSCDNDAVSADIKLETEGDDSSDDCPTGLSPNAYHPRRALRLALMEWLPEFNKSVSAFGPVCQPQIPTPVPILPSVNTCMTITATTPAVPLTPGIPPTPNMNLIVEAINDSNFIPVSNPVMNSLVSENKVVLDNPPTEDAETASTVSQDNSSVSGLEPMDCNPSPSSSSLQEDTMVVETKPCDHESEDEENVIINKEEETPRIETETITPLVSDTSITSITSENELNVDDLQLLADLFYLPFEHGKLGLHFLTEFNWLKVNSHLVIEHNRDSSGTPKPEVQEWLNKASKFDEMTKAVKKMADKLLKVKNRSLLYELYPYVWDMRGVISLLNSYVQWLGFSKGWREAFISGDQEPWVFRGGLTAELQRLIPVDASNDLFVYKTPETPITTHYVIRPYTPLDRVNLYDLVLKTSDDGKDATPLFSAYPELKGDLVLGCYLENINDVTLMVVEDEAENLVGYCVADTNGSVYHDKYAAYLETLREKYPKVTVEEGSMLSPCEELLSSLSCDAEPMPESLINSYPACITLGVLHAVQDDSVTKRLLTCVLASLRAQGTFSGNVTVKAGEKNILEMYNRLGFREVATRGAYLYLGRAF
ncbi:Protein O-GlcNAcase [Armadillidium nasatum]|uniref:protein O-GlcNAcase n=1 Tax=Armadillidium nasatum TaxID=96803 RepID=A0A5N5SY52_9CRUS|nr:Protein O-GlcNAcase [Armadillidium nasatum]